LWVFEDGLGRSGDGSVVVLLDGGGGKLGERRLRGAGYGDCRRAWEELGMEKLNGRQIKTCWPVFLCPH
jgi:hypothetical protein